MAVLARHTVGEYLFDFECAQWAEMTDAAQADWTVIENTCGFAQDLGQPFASNFVGAGNGLAGKITGAAPVSVDTVDGLTVVSLEDGDADGDVLTWTAALGWHSAPGGSGSGTVTSVAATQPAEGFTISGSPITGAGAFVFTLSNDLLGVESLTGTGIPARTAADTWALRTFSAGTGIGITNADGVAGNPTFTNTAPDQTVSLSNGAGISITGTYPNFTIAATGGTNYQTLRDGGAGMTQRAAANFVDSARISFTLADDAGNNETEISADISANSVANTHIRQGVARSVIGVTGNATANVADIQGTANQVLRVNTLGNDLSFGTVATGGITNSAVTNQKLANMAAVTFKANITGGAAAPQDVTAGQMQTALGYVTGSGTANQVAYFTAGGVIASDASLTIDPTNNRVTVTGTVAATGANNGWLNVNGGAITGNVEAIRASAQVNGDLKVIIDNARNLGNTGDATFSATVGGISAGDPRVQFTITGTLTTSMGLDNSDSDKFKITPGANTPGGTVNKGLILTNDALTLIGVNKDAPKHPMDVSGRLRATQFVGFGSTWSNSDISFGAGAGTGPTINVISGTGNYLVLTFTTGTAPAANSQVFTATFPTPFPQGPSCCVFTTGNDQDLNVLKVQVSSDTAIQVNSKNGLSLPASTQIKMYMMFGGFDN